MCFTINIGREGVGYPKGGGVDNAEPGVCYIINIPVRKMPQIDQGGSVPYII
jgi:hypothetical protein